MDEVTSNLLLIHMEYKKWVTPTKQMCPKFSRHVIVEWDQEWQFCQMQESSSKHVPTKSGSAMKQGSTKYFINFMTVYWSDVNSLIISTYLLVGN